MRSTMQDVPLTVTRIMQYGTTMCGDAEVVTWQGDSARRAKYATVGERSARLASGLNHLGINGDDRVGTFMWNNQEHLEAYLAAIEKRPSVYRFVVGRATAEEPSVAGEVAGFMERLAGELADVLEHDLPLPKDRAQVWARAIVGMVHNVGDWWLDGKPLSREKLVRELTDLLFDGFPAQ